MIGDVGICPYLTRRHHRRLPHFHASRVPPLSSSHRRVLCRPTAWLLALALSALPGQLRAQRIRVGPLSPIGSETDERLMVASLVSDTAAHRTLLGSRARPFPAPRSLNRSFSSLTPSDSATFSLTVLSPAARLISNSDLPWGPNEGALRPARGLSVIASMGVDVRVGAVRLIVAPEFISEQNTAFQTIPWLFLKPSTRSEWANPFHPLPESIDLPLRFGDQPRTVVRPGQSSLTVELPGSTVVGVGTENSWWGPGVRNALLLSNNAEGYAHAFVRSAAPIETRAGAFGYEWQFGRLDESEFFDFNAANDRRTLSGLLATWRPPGATGLTFGMARLVIAPGDSGTLSVGDALNVFKDVGRPSTTPAGATGAPGPDQITSLFAHFVLPATGFESYVEWARFEQPTSLRDLLEFPGHSQGYTVGAQYARPLANGTVLRFNAEASYLEPSASLRLKPLVTTYTSRAVPQGFTNRGKTLGAAIGPGASTQGFSADLFAARWRLGVFASRTRWDNGVVRETIVPDPKASDVTLIGGAQASVRIGGLRAHVSVSDGARLNYLFQAYRATDRLERTSGVDISNKTVTLTITTALPN
jgi:hypothetical protein